MDHSSVIHFVSIAVSFLLLSCALQLVSKRWSSMPYTALLIISGFFVQLILRALGVPLRVELSPDVIYFILLPLLLFESAYRISIHHFRLQFHTISALATFGLLISIAVVTGVICWTTNLSFGTSLLFGAIISSTDPIAVIALFKQLGAPRRLGLVADGESMLNDATSVIVFKVVAMIVIGATGMSSDLFFGNALTFLWVFIASIVYGAMLGFLCSFIAARLRSNLVAMNLLALSMALFSFVSAEHTAGISGVITTVSFGVVFGNIAVPLFDHHQESAFEHFWELLSLIALSVVFFFSSLGVDMVALGSSMAYLPAVILAVLVGRSVSVYFVCFLCNRLPLFRYEPKIPLSWQHVLNWGGLRGVIPLVLAYSLPTGFAERDLLIALTIGCFLFTLLVNGFTIKPLLLFLRLHRPQRIEELYSAQSSLLITRERLERLAQLSTAAFDRKVIETQRQGLIAKQNESLSILCGENNYSEILRSFKMAGNMLERESTRELFNKGYMNGEILSAFNSQLNQQLDRIEFPELPHRAAKKDFSFDTSTSWRNRFAEIFGIDPANRALYWLFGASREKILQNRYSLLQVRLVTSQEAVKYFSNLREALKDCTLICQALDEIEKEQQSYIHKNRREMILLRRAFPKVVRAGQQQVLQAALEDPELERLPT